MKCPVCAAAELVHDTRNLPYVCDGEATIIPAVVGDYCPACGEVVFDAAQSGRVSAAMLAISNSKPDGARSRISGSSRLRAVLMAPLRHALTLLLF